MSSSIEKIIIIAMYLVILISIPLFIDYLFKITVRRKRINQVKSMAQKQANDKNKSLIIFDSTTHGVVITNTKGNISKEEFNGDINEIANNLANNSCVIMISEVLEYVNKPDELIKQLKIVSGDDLYIVNIEKNSPRILWDYKIKNVMDKSYYLPTDKKLKWTQPNKLQLNTQNFYSYIFKIVPYDFFTKNYVEKV
jgi:hypothetical protein